MTMIGMAKNNGAAAEHGHADTDMRTRTVGHRYEDTDMWTGTFGHGQSETDMRRRI